MYGTVQWFSDSKGFGYIIDDITRQELFAHFSEIKSPGPKVLKDGQRVRYDIRPGGPTGSRAVDILSI